MADHTSGSRVSNLGYPYLYQERLIDMADTIAAINRVRTRPEWLVSIYLESSILNGDVYEGDFEFDIEGLATYRVRWIGDVETPEESNPPDSWVFTVQDRLAFIERTDNQPDPLA